MQWDNDLIWTLVPPSLSAFGFSVGLHHDLPILRASTSGTAFLPLHQRLMKHFKLLPHVLEGIFFAQSRNLANVMFYSKTLNKRSCVSNSVWVGKVREKKTKTREGAANGAKM